jgi:hypothetical protein
MQQAVLPHHHFLDGLADIHQEVEAVCDLHGPRRAFVNAGGVSRRAIAADDLDAGISTEPHAQGRGLSIGQQVDDTTLL